jgi:GTP cyclohydrolase-4
MPRVGVTNVEKVTRVGAQLYYARLDCFVDLGPDGGGPRFDEVINDVIGAVVLGEGAFKAEQLARRIAVETRERLHALRAEVTIAARYPEYKPAPVSGITTQEIYTLLGSAVASERGTRRLIGVAAQGMTTSPDAQRLVAARSRERLAADGFSDDEIAGILGVMPLATHDQRGLGTLHLGLPEDCATDIDAAIRGVIERFGGLGDDVFVSARQENLETVHQHTVVAERFGLLGELRSGSDGARRRTMREWLSAA